MKMVCSIVITTRNRAQSLNETLAALNTIEMPAGLTTEILVVDNASNDGTEAVVANYRDAKFPVRYILEPRVGQSHARNTGIARTDSEVVLYTDDDVRPPLNWLELMVGPLLKRKCDAIGGPLKLAPELMRPWMTKDYWGGIAKYDGPVNEPQVLVGANMGFHRSVFDRVPAFDPEVGPGALGFFDDTLFGMQCAEAGFRLRFVPEASVLHYADASRLLRRHCISERVKYGESSAYVRHHWRHEDLPGARKRCYTLALKLAIRRKLQPPQPLDEEGMPPWEVSYVADLALNRRFLIERRRPRNYSKRGLLKQLVS